MSYTIRKPMKSHGKNQIFSPFWKSVEEIWKRSLNTPSMLVHELSKNSENFIAYLIDAPANIKNHFVLVSTNASWSDLSNTT